MSLKKRDQIWQRPEILRRMTKVKEEIESHLQGSAEAEVFKKIQDQNLQISSENFEQQLDHLIYVIEVLRFYSLRSSTSYENLERLYNLAQKILAEQGVRRTSRLSFLYGELNQIFSGALRARGRHWLADWYEGLAAKNKSSSTDIEFQVEALLKLKNIGAACELLTENLRNPSLSESEKLRLEVLFCRCLRLSGDELTSYQNLRALVPSSSAVDWELCLNKLQMTSQFDEIFEFVQKKLKDDPEVESVRRVLEAKLWSLAIKKTEWSPKLPTLSHLRRLMKNNGIEDPSLLALFEVIAILENSLDNDVDLESRLHEMGTLLEGVPELATIEQEYLVWCASSRILYRLHQKVLLQQTLERVKSLSLGLSSGQSHDVFGISSDILENQTVCKKISTGWADRTKTFTSLTFQLLSVLGRNRLSSIMRGEPPKLTDTEVEKVVSTIGFHLSNLKGPIMKVGQTASYCIGDLSEQFDLVKLQDRSTPLAFDVMKGVLEKSLKRRMNEVFRDFDESPLGVGSIGQVYRARLVDGQPVAVKIQYPEIEKAIDIDMKIVRGLSPFFRYLAPRSNFLQIFNELSQRIREECDYVREARFQDYFSKKFESHSKIGVPRVFFDLSSERVLVSELVQGIDFTKFKATAQPSAKDEAGESIVRFVISSVRDGIFNSDPHPGNLLFDGQKVHFVDFGSVKEWNPIQTKSWCDLIRSGVNNDFDLFKKSLVEMKVALPQSDFDFEKAFKHFVSLEQGEWTSVGEFSLDQKVLQSRHQTMFQIISIPASYLLGFRLYSGLTSTVALLGAKTNWNSIVREEVG